MAATESQISAFVSTVTRDLLEAHARSSGIKKGHVVEMALLHYLHALQELPADIVIPPRLVVTRETGNRILRKARRPTKAMRELMRDD